MTNNMSALSEIFRQFLVYLLLFLVTRSVYSHVSISVNHTQERIPLFHLFECKISKTSISLNCSITLRTSRIVTKDADNYLTGCHNYSKDHLTVVMDLATDLTSFECISTNPFTITFDFENGKPRVQYMKFKRERIITNHFFDRNSYLFRMKMVVPRNSLYEIEDKKTSWFTYTLFSLNPELQDHTLKIRFCLQSRDVHQFFGFSNAGKQIFFDLSMSNTTIEITKDILFVPCFSLQRVNLYFVEKSSRSICFGYFGTLCESHSTSIVDLSDLALSYLPLEGFKLNVTTLKNKNGMLICAGEELKGVLKKCKPDINCVSFFLKLPPSEQYDPTNSSLQIISKLRKSKTSLLEPKTFRLICSSTRAHVTIVHNKDRDRDCANEVYYVQRLYDINRPEHRYFSEVNISQFMTKNLSAVQLDCVESNKVIQIWRLYFDTFEEHLTGLTFNPDQKKFVCKGKSFNHVQLVQIECDDIYECRSWERSLYNKLSDDGTSKDQFVPLMKGTTCDMDLKSRRVEFCVSASPVKKAFIQCFAPEELLPREIFNDIHFQGYDGQTYTHSNVPTEAILKLECPGKESYIVFDENVTCSCEGHSFFHAHGIQWLAVYSNDSVSPFSEDTITYLNIQESVDKYNPISIVSIRFKFKNIKAIGCAVPLLNSSEWQNITKDVQILDGIAPKILSFDQEKEISVGDKSASLSCASSGIPMAEIDWLHNDQPIQLPLMVVSQGLYKMLIFPEYNDTFKGQYLCKASNNFGTDTKVFSISTKKALSKLGVAAIIAVTLAVCLLLAGFLTFYLIRRLRASQKLVVLLTSEEVDEFFNGVEIVTNKTDNAFALPYDEKYELPADSFLIHKKQILGSGEFGTVYKGTIDNCEGDFAFKAPNSLCTPALLKGLLAELKMMVYIGNHENILKLVGAYTKDIQRGTLYIATELCSLGSLRSHLQKIKQESVKDDAVLFRTTTFAKCLVWCEEIANGMEYLSSLHVVHSDLAARNILLTEKEVTKIADFGLSRRMSNYCDYKKTDKSNPLPWKWMAIESLREMTFSTQSDVWAYGVTIWEIFSLGNVPYPGISWAVEFVEMLDRGLRNLKPEFATNKLYDIMVSCWNKNAEYRPDFSTLKHFFIKYRLGSDEDFIEDNTQTIDRSSQYVINNDVLQ